MTLPAADRSDVPPSCEGKQTTPIVTRRFESEIDYTAMRRLTGEIIKRTGLPAYATIGDLDWWRNADNNPAADIYGVQLWLADDGGDRLHRTRSLLCLSLSQTGAADRGLTSIGNTVPYAAILKP